MTEYEIGWKVQVTEYHRTTVRIEDLPESVQEVLAAGRKIEEGSDAYDDLVSWMAETEGSETEVQTNVDEREAESIELVEHDTWVYQTDHGAERWHATCTCNAWDVLNMHTEQAAIEAGRAHEKEYQ